MFIAPSSAIIKKYKISPDKVDICDVKKTYRLDEFTYKNKYFHILVSHSTLFTEIVEVDSNGSIIDSIGKLVGSNKPFTVIEYKDSSITACVNNIKNVINHGIKIDGKLDLIKAKNIINGMPLKYLGFVTPNELQKRHS